ncbi:class I SAM-dependent methyltransferase [Streptomyces sp. HNM0574]|uniref:class I SAM-dependent DNA methyltransferase n=1 Tax=Streptomyces sp. HNM0574 TaxID=2714954 RepID=UPI00146B902A|nr:class I SAM-dependent methyltransferase [Streptomyces sp. HNM0574]NLU68546.1 class I SAM-dependent methyltransferase [Streptomyces sp. HNM0574]
MSSAPEAVHSAYSAEHAEIYDFIHAARGRDWAAEADELAGIVKQRNPGADSVLDVACGTGEHLVHFSRRFGRADGLELSEGMRRIAQAKLPHGRVHAGDMRDFALGTTYDAVLCMCFSLAYAADEAEMRAGAAALVRHLAPGGVVVAEPWWFPEKFLDGFVSAGLAQEPGRAVSRLSHSTREGRSSRMTVRYTVADTKGIREFTEHEVYSLFTQQEYEDAFAAAGCPVTYHPGGPNGRGLFIGRRETGPGA